MQDKEKLDLYLRAKDAYYNGEEIMSDYEFDELEKELGLENKSQIGAHHNLAYTIKHPYIMGSLSKVQIHEQKGVIAWQEYFDQVKRFINPKVECIVTPKYDGCSFEIYVKNNNVTISSRGDGEYGKDLKKHLINKLPYKLLQLTEEFTLRGEVLIKKQVFETKYAEQFTNPRSFVSGVLNSDYSNDKEFLSKLADLDIVIYDYRVYDENHDLWMDLDWEMIINRMRGDSFFDEQSKRQIYDLLPSLCHNLYFDKCDKLRNTYWAFDEYRKKCEYALDGIVIKPIWEDRMDSTNEKRPKDCVAIKFIPMLQETEVTDIQWKLSKTYEYMPVICVKDVIMDGKTVNRCSGHNYGYLRDNKITKGTKVVLSMAGDIIPFLYKVTQQSDNEIILPCDISELRIDGCHLYPKTIDETTQRKLKFINSATTLNIPFMGEKLCEKIFENSGNVFTNVLQLDANKFDKYIGEGRLAERAADSYKKYMKSITLANIIQSMTIKLCGQKIAEQCAEYLTTGKASFEHLAAEGYNWVFDKNSSERKALDELLKNMDKKIEDFETNIDANTTKTKVILTGSPSNYKTKGEFLKMNPQYVETTKWNECEILFTGDMESTSSKMKKAKDKGIEIRLY